MSEETKALVEDENVEEEESEEEEPEDGGAGGKQDNPSDNGKPKGKATKTFTQEQVSRMMTREKNQGRAAVYRELGIDPKDTKTITLLQTVLKGKGSSDDDGQVRDLEQRAAVAEMKAEAMQQGAQAEFVEDIVTLAMKKVGDGTDAATAVGEVKTKYPIWFGVNDKTGDDKPGDDANKKVGEKGTGASVKGKTGTTKKNEQNFGARLAAQRKAHNPSKKSFWG